MLMKTCERRKGKGRALPPPISCDVTLSFSSLVFTHIPFFFFSLMLLNTMTDNRLSLFRQWRRYAILYQDSLERHP